MTRIKDKPVRRVINGRISHAIGELVVTLYPNAIMGLREVGRRKEMKFDLGQIYVKGIAVEMAERKGRRSRVRRCSRAHR